MAATLEQLRLPAFKSLRNAYVRLGPLTLLVGRNGSGKSNVIDAAAVLSALASGMTVRDALDGGRDGPLVRGGSEGCAPVGDDVFKIGCAAKIDGKIYYLAVNVSVRPSVQIVRERLWTQRIGGSRHGEIQDLLGTDAPRKDSGDIDARWDNRKQGPNPTVTFRATQLLTSQVATRVPATSQAGRHIHNVAEHMLAALRGIFILDPIPQQMREYVPEKDTRLRRNAENLSAVLASLMRNQDARRTLFEMTRSLSEAQVADLGVVSSDLGDVMTTMQEQLGDSKRSIPARLMSDGTLRFLAIAAALLEARPVDDESADSTPVSRLLVVEELENGLHPSQVELLLGRLKSAAAAGARTLATTHSPAILDALEGEDHEGVIVCSRDSDGWTQSTRLTDFPDYFEVIGGGPLGTSAIRDRLRPSEHAPAKQRSLVDVLGL